MGYGVFSTKNGNGTSSVAVNANLVCAIQQDAGGNLTMWTGGSVSFALTETTNVVYQKLVDAKAGNGIAVFPMLPPGGELTVDVDRVTALQQGAQGKVRIYLTGGLTRFALSEEKDVVIARLSAARASNGIVF